ncbi:MAG: Fis family transcriptional regulator [Desulfobacteraceae bacterium 4572_35.1]|nr:MAG: Fis family transcriptional regulator [Desulfobacteraceae bacterium 4572_35.1]
MGIKRRGNNTDNATATDAILESICDGVFTVDEHWRITSFNRAAEQITGTNREQAIGQLCSEVFRSNMCESQCALRQTLKDGKPIINRSGYIINADGKRVPVSISTAVLRDNSGEIIGGAETFRDLSEVEALRKELNGRYQLGDLVSHSPAMHDIFNLISALASSGNTTVLIQGETGTGKELVARAIHNLSERASAPFIAVNCGALPDNLLESELFGYKKGAFTGANTDKPGRFALAKQGTIFLDEIGEISPALQVRLLRVLQEQRYEPLGATKSETTEARVIAATNRNLEQLVQQGGFRQDLFYRIQVVQIDLPPLRERLEDIPLLADHFIAHFNQIQHKSINTISAAAMTCLVSHTWPGNVRELENVIERAFVLCPAQTIDVEHLPPTLQRHCPPQPRPAPSTDPTLQTDTMQEQRNLHERQLIISTLQRNNYNRAATARELNIHKTTLYRKIKQLDIELPKIDGRHGDTVA